MNFVGYVITVQTLISEVADHVFLFSNLYIFSVSVDCKVFSVVLVTNYTRKASLFSKNRNSVCRLVCAVTTAIVGTQIHANLCVATKAEGQLNSASGIVDNKGVYANVALRTSDNESPCY